MKCKVASYHLVGTTKYDIPLLSASHTPDEVLERQRSNDYIRQCLTDSKAYNSNEDENDLCGICQISFNHHCNHCTIKISLPSKNDVNIHRQTTDIECKEKLCPLSHGVCNHFFHKHCIQRWLEQGSSGKKCPMCRQDYYKDDDDNGQEDEEEDDLEELME
ncbi:hypothetical protein QEN19_004086 [Hanseniaspora menglaensis]